jgi:hypothetical protein
MQTSYSYDQAAAVPGMLHGSGSRDIVTRIAGEDLDFGRFVIADPANPGKVKYATDDTGNVVGVVIFKEMLPQQTDGGKPIQAGDPVAILRKGSIWCEAFMGGSTPAEFDTIKIHNDDTDATSIAKYGKVTGQAASANVIRTMASRATFLAKPAAADTTVLVEVNLP